jgi:hypothetical protein
LPAEVKLKHEEYEHAMLPDLEITQVTSSAYNGVGTISANSIYVLETGERAIRTQRIGSDEHTWRQLRWFKKKKGET